MNNKDLNDDLSAIQKTYDLQRGDISFVRQQILELEQKLGRTPDSDEIQKLLGDIGIRENESVSELILKKVKDHEGTASTLAEYGRKELSKKHLKIAREIKRNMFSRVKIEGD